VNLVPEPLSRLIAAFGQLPGIGPRSAERLALHVVQAPPEEAQRLSDALVAARSQVTACTNCGALASSQPCALCQDPRRDPALVCVVERAVDVFPLEKSGAFRGRYHVLGGRISPVNGVGPDELRVSALEDRLGREPIREVVLALGTDVEGDATGYYLARRLAIRGVKVTRLASGLPAGSGLEFADEVTLSRALEGRRELE
jgi:recombination protein RecR